MTAPRDLNDPIWAEFNQAMRNALEIGMKTAVEVIADEILETEDDYTAFGAGVVADKIIERLERYGFRIIRHRIVEDAK